MSTTSWDKLKKVREEEFFVKEERAKIAAIKAERAAATQFLTETKEKMETFERGFSPISGKSMFRATVADFTVLDCPEEGTITLTYDVLQDILTEAKKSDSDVLKTWERFLDVAMNPTTNVEETAE